MLRIKVHKRGSKENVRATKYTEDDLYDIFFTAFSAGIAVADGTFGEEDFMGPAWGKAQDFLDNDWNGISDGWKELFYYCGGDVNLPGFTSRLFSLQPRTKKRIGKSERALREWDKAGRPKGAGVMVELLNDGK